MNLQDLKTTLRQMKNGLERTRRQYKKVVEATKKPRDAFNKEISLFLKRGDVTMTELTREVQSVTELWVETVIFFESFSTKDQAIKTDASAFFEPRIPALDHMKIIFFLHDEVGGFLPL